MTYLDSHSSIFFLWSNPVKWSTSNFFGQPAVYAVRTLYLVMDSVVVCVCFSFFLVCVCFFCPSSPLKLIGGSVCQHFQACMGHTFLGGSSSMHASDNHEGVGRIPERAGKKKTKKKIKQKLARTLTRHRAVDVGDHSKVCHSLLLQSLVGHDL